jgi:opacity protein-like surface antigen
VQIGESQGHFEAVRALLLLPSGRSVRLPKEDSLPLIRGLTVSTLAMVIWAAGATSARADGFVFPFVGVNFGGDAQGTFNSNVRDRSHAAYGVSIGGMGGGVFGVELEVAYSPRFYGHGVLIGNNGVLTVMPAFILGIPIGGQQGVGFRPYATAGLGMTRRTLTLAGVEFDRSDLAYSFGGGAMFYFADHVGIRGDYKYLRNVEVNEFSLGNIDFHEGTFDFSRTTFGLVFRF